MTHFKSIFAAIAVVFVSACGSLAAVDPVQDEEVAALVNDAVNAQNLSVEINYINPAYGPARPSADGYHLTIKDGIVNSYLPFFGVSHGTAGVYGMEPAGIEFKDCPVEINTLASKPGKGKYVYSFIARSGNEKVAVSITFWTNGSAQISCNPENRSIMSYSGILTKIPEPKKK